MKVMRDMINKRVQEHADYVEKIYPQYIRFFTALQGSQNYGLSDEYSDVDTKTLVIPTFKELIFNKNRVSTTLEVAPTIEHADVKDMREMFNCFRKQNINFIEILFTPYVSVNPMFQEEYNALYNSRERIARYNPYQGLRAMIGHLMEKYHAFDHPYPNSLAKIEKFGYDPKQLHHMLRIQEFMIRFLVNEETYENCLKSNNAECLIAVKRGSIPLDEAREIREGVKTWADEFLVEWRAKLIDCPPDESVDKLLDDVIYSCFRKAFNQ